jgi:ATP-dependent helicase/DNAse subunit B
MVIGLAIYPTAHKVEDVLRRESVNRCLWNHRVLTFPQLIDALWRECASGRVSLDSLGERLVVERALEVAKWDASRTPGVIDQLSGVIRRFKSAALLPDDVNQAIEGVRQHHRRQRLRSLAGVFRAYQSILAERSMADAHDREMSALNFLLNAERGGKRPRILEGVRRLLIAEIYDFSLLQFMIVVALIRIIGDAEITIQAQPYNINDAGRFADLTWNRFVAEESIADHVLPNFVRRGGRRGRLGFLLERIFDGSTDLAVPPVDDTVRIFSASSREAEVEEVCRSIRAAIASGRVSPGRIAVVARDLEPYKAVLESVFARFRVPLRMYGGRPLNQFSQVRAALDFLAAAASPLERKTLVRILRSPHVSTRVARCEELLRACNYIAEGSRSLAQCVDTALRDLLERHENAGDPSLRERLERIHERRSHQSALLKRIAAAFSAMTQRATFRDHLLRLKEILDILDFDAARTRETVDINTAAWNQFVENLEQIARAEAMLSSGRELDVAEFALLANIAAQEESESDSGFEVNGVVRAFSVLDARGLDFDQVFVIGLNDGSFPRLTAEDPLLPDDAIFQMNPSLGDALRRRFGHAAPVAVQPVLRANAHRSGEDYLLFFFALSMPEQMLTLSYPTSDDCGGALSRSPFIDEILNLFAGYLVEESVHNTHLVTELSHCYTDGDFLAYGARHDLLPALANALVSRQEADSLVDRIRRTRERERYLALPSREEQSDGARNQSKQAAADEFNGLLRGDPRLAAIVLGTAEAPRPWNGAMLSEYASCGFKFFARRVLNLTEDEEVDYEDSPLEVGTLAHQLLREIFRAQPDFSSRDAALATIRPVMDRIAAEWRLKARDPNFFDLQWEMLPLMVDEVIDFEVDRRAWLAHLPELRLEYEFAFSLKDPDGRLPSDRRKLQLKGIIDRVEISRDSAGRITKIEVIDYKTSRRSTNYEKLLRQFGKTEFQLAVYVLAMVDELGARIAPEAVINATYLVPRSRNKLVSIPIKRDASDLESSAGHQAAVAGLQFLPDKIIALAAEAAAGHFEVDPLVCDDYCPYRRVCRNFRTNAAAVSD